MSNPVIWMEGLGPPRNDSLRILVELGVYSNDHMRIFTNDEVRTVVDITCNISPWMEVGYALQILYSGLATKYIEDTSTRLYINMWIKTRYADMSLEEFLAKCQ